MFADAENNSNLRLPTSELACSIVHDTMRKILLSKNRNSKICRIYCFICSVLFFAMILCYYFLPTYRTFKVYAKS